MKGLFACLLLTGFAQAVQVYLSPSPQLAPSQKLSPEQASFALSRHLGLEFFETAGDRDLFDGDSEQKFVAQGSSNALLLIMNEGEARGTNTSFNILQHCLTLFQMCYLPV